MGLKLLQRRAHNFNQQAVPITADAMVHVNIARRLIDPRIDGGHLSREGGFRKGTNPQVHIICHRDLLELLQADQIGPRQNILSDVGLTNTQLAAEWSQDGFLGDQRLDPLDLGNMAVPHGHSRVVVAL